MNEAEFFIREIAAILAGTDPSNRRIAMGPGPTSKSKTIVALVVNGPVTVDASNTREWLLERHLEDSSRPGRDFLTSALRTVTPDSASDVLYLEAGPGRYLVVTALGKPVKSVPSYKFADAASALGEGWAMDDLYCAVSVGELLGYMSDQQIDAVSTVGSQILSAVVQHVGEVQ